MEQIPPTMEQTSSSSSLPVSDLPNLDHVSPDGKAQSVANSTPRPSSPSYPPSTSTDASSMAAKKKGIASTIKKAPKRPKNGGPRALKKQKQASASEGPEEGSDDDEEDNGPYCLCRGPDDHRWMIFCENCEDWFHGECINLNKDIGESLIEKFICPNCTTGTLVTIYKKTCALGGCRKPCRLSQGGESVFCSNEHAQTWWERMVARLPKGKAKGNFNDQLVQEEFMALLKSGLSGVNNQGLWKLVKAPFTDKSAKLSLDSDEAIDDQLSTIVGDEEKQFLENAAAARFELAEETLLCHKMLTLIELVQERRRTAIHAGRIGEDICGYDQRLDTIGARDAFAAWAESPDAVAIFEEGKVGDPTGGDDLVRGLCERKRCKIHSGWQKMLALGIKHQIREMAAQADEVGEEEKVVREAAKERWRRKRSERNWVDVLDC